MINWVIRDESLHLKFGINLVHNILEENQDLLTEQLMEARRKLGGAIKDQNLPKFDDSEL